MIIENWSFHSLAISLKSAPNLLFLRFRTHGSVEFYRFYVRSSTAFRCLTWRSWKIVKKSSQSLFSCLNRSKSKTSMKLSLVALSKLLRVVNLSQYPRKLSLAISIVSKQSFQFARRITQMPRIKLLMVKLTLRRHQKIWNGSSSFRLYQIWVTNDLKTLNSFSQM